MDTSEDDGILFRDTLAELLFAIIETNDEFSRAEREKVSQAELHMFQWKMARRIEEMEEQIQLIKKLQELKAAMNKGS